MNLKCVAFGVKAGLKFLISSTGVKAGGQVSTPLA